MLRWRGKGVCDGDHWSVTSASDILPSKPNMGEFRSRVIGKIGGSGDRVIARDRKGNTYYGDTEGSPTSRVIADIADIADIGKAKN
ncbi:MAG TPA: hypothetical protein VFI72_02365 [Candidatus Angelobacter sp.]|nr:hypothetical protein [Candidatus Angelobacter sp.]